MSGEKICIITGASGGIGFPLVKAFVENDYFVAAVDIDRNKFNSKIKENLLENNSNIRYYNLDVSHGEKVKRFFNDFTKDYQHLEVLVNNAGIVGRYEDFLVIDFSSWDEVIRTNLSSMFYCSQCAAQIMKERLSGRIINVSSVDSIRPEDRFSHYAAAKAGVFGLTRSMALELGKYNILVNSILPGPITTEKAGTYGMEQLISVTNRVVLKRLGDQEEVANLVLFLASEKSSFITGSSIVIDGGFLLT